MFKVTEAAKTELQNRLNVKDSNQMIRLQMRHSCFLNLKLTLEESIQPNDTEIIMDGIHFIMDKGQIHYIRDKKLDFIPDKFDFKQFEMI